MYSFLFESTYMTLAVLALLIFLVLFLWRKLTVLEGNFYILEKRVNLMKKENRETKLAKSIERSNIVMNEIFGDAVPSDACRSVGNCAFPIPEEDVVDRSTIIMSAVDAEDEDTYNKAPNTSEASDDNVKITFTNNFANDLDRKIEEAIDPVDIINALDMSENKEPKDIDSFSITSDITFNSDEKYSQKKLSKFNLDRLKDVCSQLNINSDGTKAQLITRILENNK
jgi:hypothetical protein